MRGRGGGPRLAARLICGAMATLLLATVTIAQETEAEAYGYADDFNGDATAPDTAGDFPDFPKISILQRSPDLPLTYIYQG